MKGIIDRFEGDIVVIEIDGVARDYARSSVSDCAQAGDCVAFIEGKWVTDEAETENRAGKVKKLMDNVWED
ncbi:hypothetical protein PAECIP111893_02016 [Paenibacillus plantiphilus]|uniref:DUF3006 domain-containing protein n=1 Tax=Paenibacillus plantiphilus TaxID=2905650 RepID=A0ABN8GBQ2_9BACL|nr:DUF3006 domain-containing protein [Paenibacillus plantiphilus]CAH1203627.1 hypothetical protein PAECIP111893_02016 [Paenibacillus plantiphilus]